jgi:hypothetical protein
MNTKVVKLLILCFVVFSISCEQGNESTNTFQFSVNVKDANGNPIEDVEVFVNNQLSCDFNNITRTSTSIRFGVPQECNLQLQIFDLNNRLVNSLLDVEKPAGSYGYNYNSNNYDTGEPILGGCNVLRCNIYATDIETEEVLYEENIFMCRYTFCDKIGVTDFNGNYLTSNKLYFPHLYDIPEMDRIDPDSNVIGTFSLLEIIEITIYDLISETSQTFDRVVEPGENNFDLVWDSNQIKSNINIVSDTIPINRSRSVVISSFTASYLDEAVFIEWITQSEIDNQGWNVYRGENDIIEYALLINNSIISGMGTTYEPIDYAYVDNNIIEYSTYWYWIESLEINGTTQIFGPVFIAIPEIEPDPPMEWDIKHYPNPFN